MFRESLTRSKRLFADGQPLARMVAVFRQPSAPGQEPARHHALAEGGIVFLLGCGMALSNLVNPANWPLGARMAYWTSGFLLAWGLFHALRRVGLAITRFIGIGSLWADLIATAIMVVVITWTAAWLAGGASAALGPAFARILPLTLAIAAVLFALFFLLYARHAAFAASAAAAAVPPPAALPGVAESALHRRLPAGFPPIMALCAEDHYVRVIAERHSAMILMPLAKAVALLPHGAGIQVHRSWWVARSAVVRQRRLGRDLHLVLLTGQSVPVSRSRLAGLKAEGWISE